MKMLSSYSTLFLLSTILHSLKKNEIDSLKNKLKIAIQSGEEVIEDAQLAQVAITWGFL